MRFNFTFLSILPLQLSIIACTRTVVEKEIERKGYEEFQAFKHVREAPANLQRVSPAIVKISFDSGSGTGFFVSNQGVFMTNNHVVGVETCLKSGCYFKLRLDYEAGKDVKSQRVFAEPLAIAADLDVSVWQLYRTDSSGQVLKSEKLGTADFLKFQSMTAKDAQGKEMHLMGHPLSTLKRWSQGQGRETYGKWFYSSVLGLPGNSGSPYLNNEGQVIGIHHRGNHNVVDASSDTLGNLAIGTPSVEILSFLSREGFAFNVNGLQSPKTPSKSIDILPTLEQLSSLQFSGPLGETLDTLFFNAGIGEISSPSGAAPQKIVESIMNQCEISINSGFNLQFSSPDQFSEHFAPCWRFAKWIDCTSSNPLPFKSCPLKRAQDVAQLILKEHDLRYKFSGRAMPNMAAWMMAQFQPQETSIEQRQSIGMAILKDFFASHPMDLNLQIAGVFMNFASPNQHPTYNNVDLTSYLLNYKSAPDHKRQLSVVTDALYAGVSYGVIAREDALKTLASIKAEPSLSISDALQLDETLYFLDAL